MNTASNFVCKKNDTNQTPAMQSTSQSQSSRRQFLTTTASAALAFPYVASRSWAKSPNETVRHVSFGANGMAFADLNAISKVSNVKMVAAAEVDPARATRFAKAFPKAKVYSDWRELLDKEAKNFDTANV